MRIAFYLTLLISPWLMAEVTPEDKGHSLPEWTYTTENIAEDFRSLLESKIGELSQNFIRELDSGNVTFRSDRTIHCPLGSHRYDRDIVTQVLYKKKFFTTDQEGIKRLKETLEYRGCRGEKVFIEAFDTFGKNPEPLRLETILKGGIRVDLNTQEDQRRYSLIDLNSQRLIDVFTQRTNHEVLTVFTLGNDPVLAIKHEKTSAQESIAYSIRPKLELSWQPTPGGSYQWRWKGGLNFSLVMILNRKHGLRLHGPNMAIISELTFQGIFNSNISGGMFRGANSIFESFMPYFPSTKLVSGGLKSSQSLEEFQQALNFLNQNNTVQVRNFLNLWIKGIKEGSIIIDDRR